MRFEEAALQLFPALTDTIKAAQIGEIERQFNIKRPRYIDDVSNRLSRGIYRFDANRSTENDSYTPVEVQPLETDEELDARIKQTYSCLEVLTKAVGDGVTPSMIVSGAAGCGKSYTVNKVLAENEDTTVHFVRGYVRATGIFKLLYQNRQAHQTIIFDDCDSIFSDENGLNLLKAALELKKSRLICWMSEKEFFDEDGEQIPNYFDYEGQIIFLTNLDFHELIAKGNKLSPHLNALESRSIYLDLQVRTNREKMMRITQVVKDSTILKDRGITDESAVELMDYLNRNVNSLRECSLRTIEKLASLYLASPTQWEQLADSVLLRNR